MTYWIFKLSEQEQYLEQPGLTYVFDNRHSVRVTAGDSFVYLDKRSREYGFTGHGTVSGVNIETVGADESINPRIRRKYTAELEDFVNYIRPLDIRATSAEGKRNRASLGISDVNRLGWSRSIAPMSSDMFENILELAYRRNCIEPVRLNAPDYSVPDNWSVVRQRQRLESFKKAVLLRQDYACAICGTTVREVLDVAHISKYSTDVRNRANPANGIGLCAYCHRAFDRGVFRLRSDGSVSVIDGPASDAVAKAHLSNLSIEVRRRLLQGVDTELLDRC